MLTWIAVIASVGVAGFAALGGIFSLLIALFRFFSGPSRKRTRREFKGSLATTY